MPYYDLRCSKCQKEFNIKASIQDRSDLLIGCPDCGSNQLETIYRKVNVVHALNKDCDVCPGASRTPSRGGCCGGNCHHG